MAATETSLTLGEVAEATGGRLLGDPATPICGIAVHSDDVAPGALFVALRGRRADGHDFVPLARARGAAAALTGRTLDVPIPQVVVPDTAQALLPLAAAWRARFPVQAVGVTGSVGKTTTTQMIAVVLAQVGPVRVSAPEWNAELGVPLTLFGLSSSHRFLVVEMAMRGRGQIAALCAVTRPQIGVVTNVGTSHLELLGSVEEIARAKAELVEALPEHGWAILNADDPRVRVMAHRTRARGLLYGFDPAAHVRAVELRIGPEGTTFLLSTPSGCGEVHLSVPGRHLVANALAAAAAGLVCGVPLEAVCAALVAFRPVRMRMEIRLLAGGVVLVNDAYNASPESVRAAFETVRALRGGRRFVAVLGEMRELGSLHEQAHREVGRLCAEEGVDVLVTVGPAGTLIASAAREAGMSPSAILQAQDAEEAARTAQSVVRSGDVVLVKASRAVGLEHVAAALGGT